jgi:hypothetical protein
MSKFRGGARIVHPVRWMVYIAAVLAVVALAFVGFSRNFAAAHVTATPLEVLNLTIGLFFGKFPSDLGHAATWDLQLARVAAPLVLAAGVVGAFVRNSLWRLRHAGLALLRGHVIIAGLDERTVALAADVRATGRTVAVVDETAAEAHLEACRRLGCLVFAGDPSDPAVLRSVRAARAERIVVLRETDLGSLEVGLRAVRVAAGAAPVHVDVSDLRLFERVSRRPDALGDASLEHLRLFNPHAVLARRLLNDHPPDGPGIAPGDDTRAHLVLVGDSPLTHALALRAACLGHYANGTSVTVWIVDEAPDAVAARLLDAQPRLERVITLRRVAGDPVAPRTWDPLAEALGAGRTRAVVVFASPIPEENMLRLLSMPDLPGEGEVLVQVGAAGELPARIASMHSGRRPVRAFGRVDGVYTVANVFQEEIDTLAKAWHERYVRQKRAAAEEARRTDSSSEPFKPDAREHQPWERLDADLRESNRLAADHALIKIRAAGCVVGAVDRPDVVKQFPGDLVEALARLEHARWIAEKTLAGWTFGSVKDEHKRTNPSMCPYDDLSEAVKDDDRNPVRAIPDFLAGVHKAVVPASPRA